MVSTARVTHATPAAFTAHAADRDAEDAVAHQQLAARYDVLFGGGRTCQISPATSSTRILSLVV